MSVNYYNFKHPITSVLVEKIRGDSHAKVRIFVNHAFTGELTLRVSELEDFLDILIDYSKPVFHQYFGSVDKGVILERGAASPISSYVINEHFEIRSTHFLEQIVEGKRKWK